MSPAGVLEDVRVAEVPVPRRADLFVWPDTSVPTVVPEPLPKRVPGTGRAAAPPLFVWPDAPAAPAGPVAALRARWHEDLLLQNSLYIMAATGLMGALGFAFWVLCAHLFDAAAVGIASSLVSAGALLSYVALLGFNTTLVAFLPRARDPDRDVSTALNLVTLAAAVVAAVYVFVAPRVADELDVLWASPLTVVGFVVLTAATAVNLLTDSFFIAHRRARYNFVVDGLVLSSVRLALPVFLVGAGAFGAFASSGLAALVATVLSLALMARRFAFRYRPTIDAGVIRATFGYAASSYASNLLNLVPLLVLPMIVLRTQGAAQTGYYNVAFQIAHLPNGISYAVGQSLFAEGSHRRAELGRLARRSAVLNLAVLLPCVGACVIAAPLVLAPFGGEFAANAARPLLWFALGCLAVALGEWTTALLRLRERLTWLLVAKIVFVVGTCGLALWWSSPWGTAGVAGAWLAGNLLSGLFALVGVVLPARPGARPQGAR